LQKIELFFLMNKTDRLVYEKQLWKEGYNRIMGLDEVGRGCLAGPVVAAGVILKPDSNIPGLRDSKTMSESERLKLAKMIEQQSKFCIVKECDIHEIAELNILWASVSAMQKCVRAASLAPDYLLVDGNKFTATDLIPHTCIVKGDDKSASIAAASILAKVYRDQYMRTLSDEFPEYGWKTNVGYPTAKHKQALKEFGYTKYHRQSFTLGTSKKRKE
jgi:ribonuclease HII